MCEQLKTEIDAGTQAARLLAEHLESMGAANARIPVEVNGMTYVVYAFAPFGGRPPAGPEMECPSCMAVVREEGAKLVYVRSADNIDPNQPKGHAN